MMPVRLQITLGPTRTHCTVPGILYLSSDVPLCELPAFPMVCDFSCSNADTADVLSEFLLTLPESPGMLEGEGRAEPVSSLVPSHWPFFSRWSFAALNASADLFSRTSSSHSRVPGERHCCRSRCSRCDKVGSRVGFQWH